MYGDSNEVILQKLGYTPEQIREFSMKGVLG